MAHSKCSLCIRREDKNKKALKSFIPDIAKADFSEEFDKCNLPNPIKRAEILYKGEFTADYKNMEKFI